MSKKLVSEIKSYIVVSFGVFLIALAWTAFLIPNEIIGGGVNGVATLIFYTTGLPVGVSVLAINSVLLVIGFRSMGLHFSIKTIYAVTLLSGFFALLQYYIRDAFVTDKFMAAMVGAALIGTAVGLVFTQGSSTGGTDIIALIINKYRNVSPGRVILMLDVIIITSSFLVFRKIESLVYGFVVMGIISYVIDLIITGAKQSIQLFIFTRLPDVIADKIGVELARGVTFIKGTGWYTRKENDILMVIVRKNQTGQILKLIKQIDPDAFISLNTVMGVYGEGFDHIK